MKFAVLLMAVMAVFSFGGSSVAFAGQESIVAVVNQGVITASDLKARLDLIASSTGLPPSTELNNKLRPQVLDMLVDEQVKMQEAKRLKIEVAPEEIDKGFEMIANQNNIPADVFKKALTQHGIKLSTLRAQIEAQLAWTKVVQKRIRPRVEVSDADIESELDQMKARMGENQYRLAETLSVSFGRKRSFRSESLCQQIIRTAQAESGSFFESCTSVFPKCRSRTGRYDRMGLWWAGRTRS